MFKYYSRYLSAFYAGKYSISDDRMHQFPRRVFTSLDNGIHSLTPFTASNYMDFGVDSVWCWRQRDSYCWFFDIPIVDIGRRYRRHSMQKGASFAQQLIYRHRASYRYHWWFRGILLSSLFGALEKISAHYWRMLRLLYKMLSIYLFSFLSLLRWESYTVSLSFWYWFSHHFLIAIYYMRGSNQILTFTQGMPLLFLLKQ